MPPTLPSQLPSPPHGKGLSSASAAPAPSQNPGAFGDVHLAAHRYQRHLSRAQPAAAALGGGSGGGVSSGGGDRGNVRGIAAASLLRIGGLRFRLRFIQRRSFWLDYALQVLGYSSKIDDFGAADAAAADAASDELRSACSA